METRNIKDFLHLYLGCDTLDTYNDKIGKLVGVSEGEALVKHNTVWGLKHDEVKPLLRPLSDMTEEEVEGLIDLPYLNKMYSDVTYKRTPSGIEICYSVPAEDDFPYALSHEISFTLLLPDTFRFLLSKGFDVFGLIEAGLAIDKTTLKQEA